MGIRVKGVLIEVWVRGRGRGNRRMGEGDW